MHRWLASAVAATLTTATVAPAETWIVRTDLWGNHAFSTMTFTDQGGHLEGDIDGDPLEGTSAGNQLSFVTIDRDGQSARYDGRVNADHINGTVISPDPNHVGVSLPHPFTARRIPARLKYETRTLDFRPSNYSNSWDADRPPILVIWPGDTVHTTTIDSGGVDEHGKTVALFGNPQTGPFFIAGAAPGDTVAVHLKRLRLNRDYAESLDTIVGRALGGSLAAQASDVGKPVRWRLDLATGTARPENATGALAAYSVPVRPMLGGLAVAPDFGMPAISSGDTGRFGGNMDFNEVVEGNTVYLPVQQPGALLYLGDAHALQGDGETSQYALETSMEVTFSVELIKGKSIAMPHVESPSQIMVLGQAGSLDDALKAASAGMIQWLQLDYGMTLSQAAQVLGTAMHYSVPNLAGRSVGVAAKLDNALLPPSQHVVSSAPAAR